MVLYHATSKKKLLKYFQVGHILPPVRAWQTIEEAERFSKQTGRRIIVRLKYNDSFNLLLGHQNLALVSLLPYPLTDF